MMIIVDFYGEQGSDLSKVVTLDEDITGYTINSNLIDSIGTKWTNIATITDESIGEVTVTIDDSVTALMSEGVGYYQVEFTDNDGKKIKPFKGRIYIDGEIV
jgi:hypothetical protein